MQNTVKRWLEDVRGNVAITFALLSVCMVAAGGGAVDYLSQSKTHAKLQGIADVAAVDGARQLQLSGSQTMQSKQIHSVVKSSAKSAMMMKSPSQAPSTSEMTVSVIIDKENNTVDVVVTKIVKTSFLQLLGFPSQQKVVARSSARLLDGLPLCVLALEETAGKSIFAADSGKLTAGGCAVQSNSSNVAAIEATGQSLITSGTTCAVGGSNGGAGNFVPAVVSDCPVTEDPLSTRIAPNVGSCDFTDMHIHGLLKQTLDPGVYCGGIKIHAGADVTFLPGVYIIKDGKLDINQTSKATGEYVGFYFTGPKAVFEAKDTAEVDFSAPKDGPLSGLLFFEDRTQAAQGIFKITSTAVKALVGTIYLPASEFLVSVPAGGGAGSVAQESEFTVIVSKVLTINDSSNLVLNTDYTATDVPLPLSISAFTGKIVISK